jgi:hypothetical protein
MVKPPASQCLWCKCLTVKTIFAVIMGFPDGWQAESPAAASVACHTQHGQAGELQLSVIFRAGRSHAARRGGESPSRSGA